MACASCMPRKLQEGKRYHVSILYNHHDGRASERDKDQSNSYNFVKLLDEKLNGLDLTKLNYFDKLLPGSNQFASPLTMIKDSERVIIILTEGFMKNRFNTFAQQNNVQTAVKEGVLNSAILPVAIGLSKKEDIKPELGLDTANVLFFEADWENDEKSWRMLTKAFVQNMSFSTIRRSVQETNEANAEDLETDHTSLAGSTDRASKPVQETSEANAEDLETGHPSLVGSTDRTSKSVFRRVVDFIVFLPQLLDPGQYA